MSFLRSFFAKRRANDLKVDVSQRFDLVSRLGTGSMSKVWRAVDRKSGHVVALKILDRAKTARYEARFTDRVKPTEGQVAIGAVPPAHRQDLRPRGDDEQRAVPRDGTDRGDWPGLSRRRRKTTRCTNIACGS